MKRAKEFLVVQVETGRDMTTTPKPESLDPEWETIVPDAATEKAHREEPITVRISTQTERELVLEKGSTISTKRTGLRKTPERGREKRRERVSERVSERERTREWAPNFGEISRDLDRFCHSFQGPISATSLSNRGNTSFNEPL